MNDKLSIFRIFYKYCLFVIQIVQELKLEYFKMFSKFLFLNNKIMHLNFFISKKIKILIKNFK